MAVTKGKHRGVKEHVASIPDKHTISQKPSLHPYPDNVQKLRSEGGIEVSTQPIKDLQNYMTGIVNIHS